MSASGVFRWGYIGAGDVCEKKSAPEAFLRSGSDVIVEAVMRRNLAQAQDFAERHGVSHAYSSVEELLGKESEVNSIYVATPPSTHFQYTLDSLEAGIKRIYIEKPVCLNAEDAKLLKKKAEEKDADIVVAHYRNELPMYLNVEKMLSDGTLGTIRSVNIKIWQAKDAANGGWRLNPAVSGGGYFHDLAPHVLALMLKWFGPFSNTQGQHLSQKLVLSEEEKGQGVPDSVTGSAIFEEGNVLFNGSWCFSVPECEEIDECLIVGSLGSLRFPFFKGSDVTLRLNEIGGAEAIQHFEHPQHIQEPMIAAMMRYFREKEEQKQQKQGTNVNNDGIDVGKGSCCNPCSIDDAIAVMEVMDRLTAT